MEEAGVSMSLPEAIVEPQAPEGPAAASAVAQGEVGDALSMACAAALAASADSNDPVRNLFYQRYTPVFHKAKKGGTSLITNEEYARFVKILSTWQPGVAHTAEQARVHKKYTIVLHAVEGDNLRRKGKRVPTFEQVYHIIQQKHQALGHARALRKNKKAVDDDYYGVPESAVKIFLDCCPICAQSKTKNKGSSSEQLPLHIKNILLSTIGARAQLDLIEMTHMESDGFKHILLYTDLFSGFRHAVPIRERSEEYISEGLQSIMSVAVVPTVLYSQNCADFLGVAIHTIKDMFPGAHVILGRSQTESNSIASMTFIVAFRQALDEWMSSKSRQDWHRGCFAVNAKLNMQPSGQNNNLSPYQLYYSKAPQPVLFTALGEIAYKVLSEDGLFAAISAAEQGKDVAAAVAEADKNFFSNKPDTTLQPEQKMQIV